MIKDLACNLVSLRDSEIKLKRGWVWDYRRFREAGGDSSVIYVSYMTRDMYLLGTLNQNKNYFSQK